MGGIHRTVISCLENRERRDQLLEIYKRLMSQGDCIDPPHEIIRKMVEHFEVSPTFDWRQVSVDFPETPNIIAREENFSDELADEEREQLRVLYRQFVKVYVDVKPAFDTLFKCSTAGIPLSVADLVARLKMPNRDPATALSPESAAMAPASRSCAR